MFRSSVKAKCFLSAVIKLMSTEQIKIRILLTFEGICGIMSAGKNAEIGEKPCTFVFMGDVKMYKYRSKQISLTDFNTPVGMKLNPDNRWVKKLN